MKPGNVVPYFVVPLIALLAFALGKRVRHVPDVGESGTQVVGVAQAIGQRLPDFVLHDDSGRVERFRASANATYTLLAIASTTCSDCIGELLRWQELETGMKGRLALRVAGCSADGRVQGMSAGTYVWGCGPDLPLRLKVSNFPALFIIDSLNVVVYARDGELALDSVSTWLDKQF